MPGRSILGIGPFVRDDGADHIGAKADSMFPCPISGKIIPWENKSVLCAGAVVKDNKVFMFYRAEDLSRGNSWGTSRIGLAVSEDGRHFKRHPIPVLYPDRDFMRITNGLAVARTLASRKQRMALML